MPDSPSSRTSSQSSRPIFWGVRWQPATSCPARHLLAGIVRSLRGHDGWISRTRMSCRFPRSPWVLAIRREQRRGAVMPFNLIRDRYLDVVRALAGSPIRHGRRVPSVRRGPLRPSERRCTCRARPRVPSGLHSGVRDPHGQRTLPPIGLAAAGIRSERMAQAQAEPVASQPRPPGTPDRTSHKEARRRRLHVARPPEDQARAQARAEGADDDLAAH